MIVSQRQRHLARLWRWYCAQCLACYNSAIAHLYCFCLCSCLIVGVSSQCRIAALARSVLLLSRGVDSHFASPAFRSCGLTYLKAFYRLHVHSLSRAAYQWIALRAGCAARWALSFSAFSARRLLHRSSMLPLSLLVRFLCGNFSPPRWVRPGFSKLNRSEDLQSLNNSSIVTAVIIHKAAQASLRAWSTKLGLPLRQQSIIRPTSYGNPHFQSIRDTRGHRTLVHSKCS